MKIPQGFRSWVEVVDYLNKNNTGYKTAYFKRMLPNGNVTTNKITLRTAERNAWREIQNDRLNEDEVYIAVSVLYREDWITPSIKEKINKFLKKTCFN